MKLGKITDTEAAKNAWRDKLLADFDGTKNLLDSMPVNRKSPVTSIEGAKDAGSFSVENYMAELRSKNNIV